MTHSKIIKSSSLAIALVGAFAFTGSAIAMEISLQEVDLNGDGKVSEAELINVVQTHFMTMDKDGSNNVSSAEWLAAESAER